MAERALSASVLAAIASGSVRPFLLFEGEYLSGSSTAFLRLFTGAGTLSWDGKSWVGGRDLLSISPIRESTSLEAIGFSVRLSGMPADKLSVFLQSMRKNKAGRLWLGFMEPEVVDFRFTEATLLAKHGAGVATVTVTRAGATATRVNELGLIETVAADTPRFDYDPVTLGCKGLLIEGASTNLQRYSGDTTQWPVYQATRGSSIIGPDGGNVPKLVEDTSSGVHRYNGLPTPTLSAIEYTISIYAKAGERTAVRFFIWNPTDGSWATTFADLVAVTATGGTIEAVGNGWYRITVKGTPTTLTGNNIYCDMASPAGSTTYVGDGVSGMYLWGAQIEQGAAASSYIPTTSVAVTRNADVATVADVSGFYNQSEGSAVVEFSVKGVPPAVQCAATFSDGTQDNEVVLLTYDVLTQLVIRESASSTVGFVDTAVADTPIRMAAAWRANDAALSQEGGAVQTDGSVVLPTVTKLNIGSIGDNTSFLNGHLRRFTYYPRRLPNETLQQLSTPGAEDIVWGSERVITDPYPLRRGRFDMAPISRDAGSGTMTIEARYEGPLARLLIPNVRHYTHEDQQLRLVGDKGFDQVEALQDTQDLWGPEVPVFPKTTRSPRPDPRTQTA